MVDTLKEAEEIIRKARLPQKQGEGFSPAIQNIRQAALKKKRPLTR